MGWLMIALGWDYSQQWGELCELGVVPGQSCGQWTAGPRRASLGHIWDFLKIWSCAVSHEFQLTSRTSEQSVLLWRRLRNFHNKQERLATWVCNNMSKWVVCLAICCIFLRQVKILHFIAYLFACEYIVIVSFLPFYVSLWHRPIGLREN